MKCLSNGLDAADLLDPPALLSLAFLLPEYETLRISNTQNVLNSGVLTASCESRYSTETGDADGPSWKSRGWHTKSLTSTPGRGCSR